MAGELLHKPSITPPSSQSPPGQRPPGQHGRHAEPARQGMKPARRGGDPALGHVADGDPGPLQTPEELEVFGQLQMLVKAAASHEQLALTVEHLGPQAEEDLAKLDETEEATVEDVVRVSHDPHAPRRMALAGPRHHALPQVWSHAGGGIEEEEPATSRDRRATVFRPG